MAARGVRRSVWQNPPVTSPDDARRQSEQQRRDAAAARAAQREEAFAAGAEAGHDVSDALPKRTLMLLGAGVLAAAGAVAGLFSLAGALLLFLPAIALAGYAWRSEGVSRPKRAVLSSDPLVAAYEDARAGVDRSLRIDEERRIELLGTLRTAFDQAQAVEANRAELDSSLAALPPGEQRDELAASLEVLAGRRQAFLDHCARLRRTVTALDLSGGEGPALEELAAAATDLEAEAAAEAELRNALRAARAPTGMKHD